MSLIRKWNVAPHWPRGGPGDTNLPSISNTQTNIRHLGNKNHILILSSVMIFTFTAIRILQQPHVYIYKLCLLHIVSNKLRMHFRITPVHLCYYSIFYYTRGPFGYRHCAWSQFKLDDRFALLANRSLAVCVHATGATVVTCPKFTNFLLWIGNQIWFVIENWFAK